MSLPDNFLVSNEEMIIKGTFYIKMRISDYLLELYHDAITTNSRQFNRSFSDNVDMFIDRLKVADDLSAQERIIILKVLPDVPEFLTGNKFLTFKTTENIYQDIGHISKILNNRIGNITRILIYLSLPINLVVDFSHLLYHYRQAEDSINYYLEMLNVEKMGIYQLYKNYMNEGFK